MDEYIQKFNKFPNAESMPPAGVYIAEFFAIRPSGQRWHDHEHTKYFYFRFEYKGRPCVIGFLSILNPAQSPLLLNLYRILFRQEPPAGMLAEEIFIPHFGKAVQVQIPKEHKKSKSTGEWYLRAVGIYKNESRTVLT